MDKRNPEEFDEIMRKGREALERILEARTLEHVAATDRRIEATEKLKTAVVEFYKATIEEAFYSYVDGHPNNIPDALEYLADKADRWGGMGEVLNKLTNKEYQDAMPDSAWWVLDEVIDILCLVDRKDVVAFWRGARS